MTSRNDRFFKGGFIGLLIAAAVLCGASASQADYSDENIATTDDSVRRLEVGGKSVYVFTNAASALTVTAKRNLAMTDCLLVGGGGAGGNTMAGGGGAGGFIELADVYSVFGAGDTIAFTAAASISAPTATRHGRRSRRFRASFSDCGESDLAV